MQWMKNNMLYIIQYSPFYRYFYHLNLENLHYCSQDPPRSRVGVITGFVIIIIITIICESSLSLSLLWFSFIINTIIITLLWLPLSLTFQLLSLSLLFNSYHYFLITFETFIHLPLSPINYFITLYLLFKYKSSDQVHNITLSSQ